MNSTTHEEPQVLPKTPTTVPNKPVKPERRTPFSPGPKINPKPKALILLLLIFIMVSCNEDKIVLTKDQYNSLKNIPQPEYPKEINIQHITGNYFQEKSTYLGHILLIDSCEYIFLDRYGDGGPILTHKGNCKFCKLRNHE